MNEPNMTVAIMYAEEIEFVLYGDFKCPNLPEVFNGRLAAFSVGYGWGIGYSYSAFSFNNGEAKYSGGSAFGGVDIGVSEMIGDSEVELIKVHDCSCGKIKEIY